MDPFAHLVKGRQHENGFREAPPDTNRVERAIKMKVIPSLLCIYTVYSTSTHLEIKVYIK